MRLMQSELVTYKASWLYDKDLPCGVESSAAKAIVLRVRDRGRRPRDPDPGRDGLLGRVPDAAVLARRPPLPDRARHEPDGAQHRRGERRAAPLVLGALTAYPHVEAPLALAGARLRNRITRTAHGTGLPARGNVTEALIAYHEARARGGVGSVFTETCTVHPSSPGTAGRLARGRRARSRGAGGAAPRHRHVRLRAAVARRHPGVPARRLARPGRRRGSPIRSTAASRSR